MNVKWGRPTRNVYKHLLSSSSEFGDSDSCDVIIHFTASVELVLLPVRLRLHNSSQHQQICKIQVLQPHRSCKAKYNDIRKMWALMYAFMYT